MSILRRTAAVVVMLLVVSLAAGAAAHGAAQEISPADLEAALPEAPSGWSAGPADSQGGSTGATYVSNTTRDYTGPDGAVATLTYTASPTMVAASRSAGMMFQNQTMIDMMNQNNSDQTIAQFDREGWTGWSILNTAEEFSEVTAFNEKIVVKIEIDTPDAESQAAFVQAIDWDALAALAAGS